MKRDLERIKKSLLASCRKRPEFREKTLVMGEGPSPCALMIIGEAPGRVEVELKRPFVGRAGKFFRSILEDVFRGRDFYITNVVKVWPKIETERGRTRSPAKEEFDFFLPYLLREIEAVHPKVIVAVGRTAFRAVTDKRDFTPGLWTEGPSGAKVMAVYHPAYILRNRKRLKELEGGLRSALLKVRRELQRRE